MQFILPGEGGDIKELLSSFSAQLPVILWFILLQACSNFIYSVLLQVYTTGISLGTSWLLPLALCLGAKGSVMHYLSPVRKAVLISTKTFDFCRGQGERQQCMGFFLTLWDVKQEGLCCWRTFVRLRGSGPVCRNEHRMFLPAVCCSVRNQSHNQQ